LFEPNEQLISLKTKVRLEDGDKDAQLCSKWTQ